MSSQKFSASQREAIWLAHQKKCAYTRELLDVSSFHVDHILPEILATTPTELNRLKTALGLSQHFDIEGYENLLPCRPGANLQKGSLVLDVAPTQFFLGIAAAKKVDVEANLKRIERRNARGKALILLQQCLERGDLDAEEVASILEQYASEPEQIFDLIEGMHFADATEVRSLAKADIESLRDRPIRLGQNDHIDGVTLTNDTGETVYVRTCRQYNDTLSAGYFAMSTFDMKMATFFEHQCGLLTALEGANQPRISFIDSPRVGIVDLELMPYCLFPQIGEHERDDDLAATYQSKVLDGSLVIKRLRNNLVQIVEPEGMGHQLIEVARADFDGDGIEDILLFEYCWATQGTLGFGGIRILTRRDANGKFEAVAINAS